jgi:C4-dicarboxylate-specific signal transduction histidine kinase
MSELMHLNRMATAGELSASIAHEVSQPLTGMVMRANAALRWLAAGTPDIGKAQEALANIVCAGQRASDIITNIRSMFRKDTQDKSEVDINELIWAVLALVAIDLRKHKIDFRSQLDVNLPRVVGNQVQLQQVILNLIMNAIDAMHSVEQRTLMVRSERDGDSIRVSVEDSGIGIDPANIDRVFKPLFTTKVDGMGMGLAICYSIILKHGGQIWVSAGRKRGSIFQLELPVNEELGVQANRVG